MMTHYEMDATTPGHWRVVNARRWIDGDGVELTFSDPGEFEDWLAHVDGQAMWSPTGPGLDYSFANATPTTKTISSVSI
jgi:hypothetical protein